MDQLKCKIATCNNRGTWKTGFCPTCRSHIRKLEGRSVAWRVHRFEQIERWQERMKLVGLPTDRTMPAARPALRVIAGGK